MSKITAAEWAEMQPTQRRQALNRISQAEAVELYALITPTISEGPRLNKSEWKSLGATGQKLLIQQMPAWEAQLVESWIDAPSAADKADDALYEASKIDKQHSQSALKFTLAISIVCLGAFLYHGYFYQPSYPSAEQRDAEELTEARRYVRDLIDRTFSSDVKTVGYWREWHAQKVSKDLYVVGLKLEIKGDIIKHTAVFGLRRTSSGWDIIRTEVD